MTYEQSGQKMAHLKALQSRHHLTGLVRCDFCGAHFIARPGYKRKMGKRYHYYGCAFHARMGNRVCPNRTYLPLEAIEQELLELLADQVLTADTTGRLLAVVNARLSAQASASRPRLQQLKAARRRVDREIKSSPRPSPEGTSPPWRGR